jgi:hypothetical protein
VGNDLSQDRPTRMGEALVGAGGLLLYPSITCPVAGQPNPVNVLMACSIRFGPLDGHLQKAVSILCDLFLDL